MSVPSHFGRYRVLRPLASGEMGAVYLAEDPLIGRHLAIKGIRFDALADDDEVERLQARFDQEIQIAGTFSHPNIVTVFDVGHQAGRPFIAMEYVDGRNLRAELQANGPMSADRAIALIAPIGRALTYAHERKIIHRDIKPTNILVSSEGVPKITDFGVARLFGSTLTNAGKIFGTPAYMSPEQARGNKLTGASDQFAVATVLYELLTGQRPFRGSSPTAVIYEVIETQPPAPHELAPLIPTAVSEVVMRGMSKDPEDRFESCAAFAQALEGAAAWAKANPDLAYFHSQADSDSGTVEVAAALTWQERLEALSQRVARIAAAASRGDVWQGTRRFLMKVSSDTRSLVVFGGAALSLVVLLTVVAWAATSRTPDPPTTPRAKQADLLTSPQPTDRGTPVGSTRRGAAEGAATDVSVAESTSDTNGLGRRSFIVGSRPPGARVTLDGVALDQASPVTILVDMGSPHTLRLELEGYEPVTWGFSSESLSPDHLTAGELFFPLRPLPAEAVVDAAPAAENVAADDAEEPDPAAVAAEPEVDPWSGYGVSGPPPSPANVRRIRAPSQAPTPERLRHVGPQFPASAPAGGVVVMEIEISARGNVVQAKVLRGIAPAIDQAALNAVVRWKYRPTSISGEPVHVLMTVTMPIR